MRRAVITGIGIISPIGTDLDSFWHALQTGQSGVGLIRRFDTSAYPNHQAAEVDGDRLAKTFTADVTDKDRLIQMALQAAEEAIHTSQLDLSLLTAQRIGVAFGTSNGHNDTFVDYWRSKNATDMDDTDCAKVDPLDGLIFRATGRVAKTIGAKGPIATFVTACAAGTNAIGYALDQIQSGTCDVMLAGGGDILSPIVFSGFCALGALAQGVPRPFSADRDGVALGEGVAWLLIEEADHAIQRGATIYAELYSYALSNDAYHATAPDPEGQGAIRAMRGAIEAIPLNPADIDYVNAHGTATTANDEMETKALLEVFGERLPAVSSSKSQFGHALGGAGALEAVVTVLALYHQFLPPTLECDQPMNERFDFVALKGRSAKLRYALSNSFAFGGNTASVVFGIPKEKV